MFLDVLAHELGHAFGMYDTYTRGVMVSTGGLAGTEGQQPSSIMAAMPGLPRPRPFPYLKEDDKNGIIWLYKYYHEGQPAGDCFFPDHVPVENVLGLTGLRSCEPRYPLIFEVKHGSRRNVLTILHDDPNLDLNGRDFWWQHRPAPRGAARSSRDGGGIVKTSGHQGQHHQQKRAHPRTVGAGG